MKQIHHPEIGLVSFKKNPRSKKITLRLKIDNTISITIPQHTSYQEAERALVRNLDWIKTQQQKLLQNPKVQSSLINYETNFQLRHKKLTFIPSNKINYYIQNQQDKIEVFVPSIWDINNKDIQIALQKITLDIFRLEAKNYLPSRTLELAKSKNISINQIRIKNVKSKWGSCSSLDNINLSLYLILLSNELIDYIIFHELAHIKHKNHSSSFWNHLEELLPGAKLLDKQMKHQHLPFFS